MAVYTEVPFDTAAQLLSNLKLGELASLQACKGGIENTNYFASTDLGDYVLTLFERLTAEQLPYYLYLTRHLASRGIPVPDPQADSNGDIVLQLMGKPAAVVNKLRGKQQLTPAPAHCAAVGEMLARMHLAGRDYPRQQANLRALPWWNETMPVVLPFLTQPQAALLCSELALQNHLSASSRYAALPGGPIHADLFRDNVMFEGETLTGLFDFYFAGNDAWLFDIAVCLNDWCINLTSGERDGLREQAFLQAYMGVRPLSQAERTLIGPMLRAAALRFWISRLWDLHLPRQASELTAHDPTHFERVLRCRVADAATPIMSA